MSHKTLILIAIVAIAFVNVFTLSAQIDLHGRDLKNYNKAISYAEDTNNKKAISMLRKLHKDNPDEINVCYNLGLCYMNMSGNPDSALYFLNRVKELDTDGWSYERGELYLAMARCYQLKYDFDTPITIYDDIDKNDTEGELKERTQREREICANAKVFMANPVKLEVKRLSDNINSESNDYRPVLSDDLQTMFFTSRRRSKVLEYDIYDDGQHEERIYVSEKKGSDWSEAKRIETLFPHKEFGQETATCISNYGTELYLVRDGEIYVSLYDSTKNDWGAATALPEPINSSSSEETFAFVSNDGGVMFFASDRKGGYGGTDIYRSYRLPNGKWGVPQNLGDIINTPYNEDSPIMHPTQNILYFSSAGHNTMGGYDIFFSILNPDSTFAAVSNIGYPINTPDDDVHFVPTTEKNVAYYSSIVWSGETDESSGFDIYEVAYEEPEIEKLVVVEGKIVASADDRIYITAENNGETVGSYQPNSKTNKFVIILEVGSEYTVRVSAGDEEIDRVVTLTEAEAYAKSGETKNIGTFEFKSGIVNATTEGDTSSSAAQQANANSNSQNDSAASTKSSTSVAKASDTKGNDAFTVQILSLREAIDVNKLKGVDASQVVEYQYKDGWFVYSVGEYKSVADVKAKRDEIISTTPYSDAFYRRISQYDKFTK